MSQAPEATQVNIASLYVGDLKPDVNETILWSVFSPYGQVLSIKVCRDSQTRTSLGYAYVNFRTAQEAEKAMESINFASIEGKSCRVMWSMRDPNRRKLGIGNVIIKNIDTQLDSKSLYVAFLTYGPILSCKIAIDEYGLGKGYGFIQFYNELDAENACAKTNGVVFMKKKLIVTKFIPKSARKDAKNINPYEFTNKDPVGKSLGHGFVNFEKPDCAAAAVASMNDFVLPNGDKLFASKAMKKLERQAFLKKEYEKRKQEYYKQPMQSRPMQSVGGPGGQGYQQQNYRHSYNYSQNYNQGGNYAQQNFRPRATHGMSRNPNPLGYSQRPRASHVSVNHVVTENVSRPRHYEPRVSQKLPSQDPRSLFKDRIYRLCQSVLLEKSFNMDYLPQVSGVVIDYFTDAHSNRGIEDKEIVDAVVNAYMDYTAPTEKPQ
ncbi:hypothetical protein MXB_4718 [Myxobolus squamalis]|nr:hypothetical protein MXB_4718 [Myxobolus squamalis]